MTKGHKAIVVAMCIILAVAAAAAGVIFMINNKKNTALLTINGERISDEEFSFYVDRCRAETANYFYKKYDAPVEKGFWTTSFEGEIPKNMLTDAAISAIRYDKAIFSDCKKRGISDGVTFESAQNDMEAENNRRKSAAEAGEPVYGNEQYEFEDYYDYVLSNLILKHQEQIAADGLLQVTDTAAERYYESIKNDYYYFKAEDGTTKSYNEVRNRVQLMYKEKLYDDYVNAVVRTQKVEIFNKALDEYTVSE